MEEWLEKLPQKESNMPQKLTPRPRRNPKAVIEDFFHALSLEEQAATLHMLAYIHWRDTEDADNELKKSLAAE